MMQPDSPVVSIDVHSRILQHPGGIHDIGGVVSLELECKESPQLRFEFLANRPALVLPFPRECQEDETFRELVDAVHEIVLFSRSFLRFTDDRTLFTPAGQFDVPGICDFAVRHGDTERPATCFYLNDGRVIVAQNWRPTSDDFIALRHRIDRRSRKTTAQRFKRETSHSPHSSSSTNNSTRVVTVQTRPQRKQQKPGSAQRRRRQTRELDDYYHHQQDHVSSKLPLDDRTQVDVDETLREDWRERMRWHHRTDSPERNYKRQRGETPPPYVESDSASTIYVE